MLTAGTALGVGIIALGDVGADQLLLALPSLLAAVVLAGRVARHRVRCPEAWLLLAGGRLLVFDAALAEQGPVGQARRYTLVATETRLVAFCVSAYGLVMLSRYLTRVWDRNRWMDSAAVSLSVGLAATTVLVWPHLAADSSWVNRFVVPALPASDLLLVLLATRALLAARPRTDSLRLLAASLVVQFGGDAVVGWANPDGVAVPSMTSMVTAAIASVLMAAAALVPSAAHAPQRVIPWRRLGWVRFSVLSASVLLPLTALVGLALAGEITTGTVAYLGAGVGIVAVLALLRVSGLITYADALADERHRSRFEALADHSHDVVAIVGSDGDLSWVSPAVAPVLALPPAELVGRPLDALFGERGADALADRLADLAQQPLGSTIDIHAAVLDGKDRLRTVEGTATNLLEEASVEGLVVVVRDITDRALLQELAAKAFLDPLTGLANRRLFVDRIEQALADRVDPRSPGLAVLFIDLDDFKWVNDTLGHACGDQLLTDVGRRMRDSIGAADVAARLGGDEFAALLVDLSAADAIGVAERMLRELTVPSTWDGQPVPVSASIGVAHMSDGSTDVANLLARADNAMYQAKAKGKGRACVFDGTVPSEIGPRDARYHPGGPAPGDAVTRTPAPGEPS